MKVLKSISRTPLFKITSLNSVSLLLKIGIGLITSKVLAIFVGPGGIALVGNLRNFMMSIETVSTLGFQNGIIKYIADYKEEEQKRHKIIATVFYTLLAVAAVLSLLLFFFADALNTIIFGTNFQYQAIFKVIALALPWYSISVLMIAVINGLGKFKKVIYTNIFGNIIGLFFSVYAVMHFDTFGALLSIVIPPALLFFAAFYHINREIPFLKSLSLSAFDPAMLKGMLSYALMALVSSVAGPLVFLAIRNNVIDTAGLEAAGYIEAMNRLSAYYMMFVSTTLTVYFLPKLTFATNPKATKNIFLSYYKGILPVFAAGLIVLYFLRFVIVRTLFSTAFLPVADLFFWQIFGDILKAAALILGYQFFAKKHTIAFIVTEITSLLNMYLLSNLLVGLYGAEGFVMAHAMNYCIYFAILIFYFRYELFDGTKP